MSWSYRTLFGVFFCLPEAGGGTSSDCVTDGSSTLSVKVSDGGESGVAGLLQNLVEVLTRVSSVTELLSQAAQKNLAEEERQVEQTHSHPDKGQNTFCSVSPHTQETKVMPKCPLCVLQSEICRSLSFLLNGKWNYCLPKRLKQRHEPFTCITPHLPQQCHLLHPRSTKTSLLPPPTAVHICCIAVVVNWPKFVPQHSNLSHKSENKYSSPLSIMYSQQMI